MFRVSRNFAAPLAKLKPILASSVAAEDVVRRIIGSRSNRHINISVLHSVVEKTKGEGLAGQAAVICRAGLYLESAQPAATLTEVEAILPKITDEPLKNLAQGLRLRALNDELDAKEAALNVSGGATEAEVSDLRAKLQAAYKDLRASNPNCWLIELADAEFRLYMGDAEGAYVQLATVENKINEFIDRAVEPSTEIASHLNTKPFSLFGFQLQRAYNTKLVKPNVASKIVADGIVSVATDPRSAESLANFKKHIDVDLTDEEATEVAFVLQAASIRHHFHEFFPDPEASEYDNWDSEEARGAATLLQAAYLPESVALSDAVLDRIRTSKPASPFYASEEELAKFIKTIPKEKNVVAAIREKFGEGPQTPLSKGDEALIDAGRAIMATKVSANAAGTPAYAIRQNEIAKALARQILYRTQVQKAVSLIEMNRMQDAVDTLTPVINANEFIYMWKAFLARSRAYRGLGLITTSDKDLKSLDKLKKSLTNRHPHDLI
ncbi:hypothetical protein AGDE_07776 [Angomonas deanei]|nr:hypothetical protein AGDE_07776 [Angomonas deanei]|eukprot:EPY34860.1 hypothetical protein AGDE_07776 [Angomonas deanei]